MNFWSALEVLGLEDDDELTRDRVRRTYMRKLRQHPPEKDPEGFRRLREAFEALRDVVPEYIERDDDEYADRDDDDYQDADRRIVVVSTPARVADLGGASIEVRPATAVTSPPVEVPSEYSIGKRIREEVPAPADDDQSQPYSLGRAEIDERNRLDRRAADNVLDEDKADDDANNKADADADDKAEDDYYTDGGDDRDSDDVDSDSDSDSDSDDYSDSDEDSDDDYDDSDSDANDDDRYDHAPGPGEPAMSLDSLVDKILLLLEHDEVEEAHSLEKIWRDNADTDDRRNTTDYTAAQWALTRELLGVSRGLPAPVIAALAKGIAAHDVASARPALEAYRRTNVDRAAQANALLAKTAPDLYKYVERALYQPPQRDYNVDPVPNVMTYENRSSGGFGPLWAILLVGVAMIRFCANSDRTSSSTYDPPDIPRFDPALYDRLTQNSYEYDRMSKLLELPDPDPIVEGASREELIAQIYTSIAHLTTRHVLTFDQKDALGRFEQVPTDDCPAMLAAYAAYEELPTMESSQAAKADAHTRAIRERLDRACPKPKPKKKTKRPKRPPAQEEQP